MLRAITNETDACYDGKTKNDSRYTLEDGTVGVSRACRKCERAGIACVLGKGIVCVNCGDDGDPCGAAGGCE